MHGSTASSDGRVFHLIFGADYHRRTLKIMELHFLAWIVLRMPMGNGTLAWFMLRVRAHASRLTLG